MNRQKTFNGSSTIYLVATPIGNLEDFTFRAINTLKSVDYIFCEDTRVSIKLLNHFEINKPLKSYHEHNKQSSGEYILELLRDGKNIALISDAGYPGISDPGYEVSQLAIEEGFNVTVVPGANAFLQALLASGINPQPFTFYGFLDHKDSKKRKELMTLAKKTETMIFYESPHRIDDTLRIMLEVLGDRKIALCRELTKKFEEYIRGNISEIIPILGELKGEMVIIVSGHIEEEKDYSEIDIFDQVSELIEEGLSEKDAIKKVAKERNLSKNDIYMEYHNRKKEA